MCTPIMAIYGTPGHRKEDISAMDGFRYIPLPEVMIMYRQVFNIRRTLAGYKIVDHSDVVGASPVGAAPTTSSFST